MKNVDSQVVADFGREWQRFNQQSASPEELQALFGAYFKVFPWEALPAGAEGADIGCGSADGLGSLPLGWVACIA